MTCGSGFCSLILLFSLGAICELQVDCLFWSWKIEDKECCTKFSDANVDETSKFISGELGCK